MKNIALEVYPLGIFNLMLDSLAPWHEELRKRFWFGKKFRERFSLSDEDIELLNEYTEIQQKD